MMCQIYTWPCPFARWSPTSWWSSDIQTHPLSSTWGQTRKCPALPSSLSRKPGASSSWGLRCNRLSTKLEQLAHVHYHFVGHLLRPLLPLQPLVTENLGKVLPRSSFLWPAFARLHLGQYGGQLLLLRYANLRRCLRNARRCDNFARTLPVWVQFG